ncbi:unnamed protein product [Linum trigynum]|uniref:Uncharacterized protein n=1 Tax=Linum trigynum TaxID=586398 RepID=A0AAV2EEG2_9ROSI
MEKKENRGGVGGPKLKKVVDLWTTTIQILPSGKFYLELGEEAMDSLAAEELRFPIPTISSDSAIVAKLCEGAKSGGGAGKEERERQESQ